MEVELEGHGIIGLVDGLTPCPPRFSSGSAEDGLNCVETDDDYQVWKMLDSALMQLIYTTLSSSAMFCVIGSKSAQEMWVKLKDRFSSKTRTEYLHRIQEARDLLYAVGVSVDDEDELSLFEIFVLYCLLRGQTLHNLLRMWLSPMLWSLIIHL